MKIMAKTLAAVCGLSLTAGILAGCGGGQTAGSDTSASPSLATQKPAVVIKAWTRGSNSDSGPTRIGERFNKSQSEIKVEWETFGENYAEMLKMALASDSAADIFELSPGTASITVKQAAEAGYIEDVEDIRAQLKDKLNPASINSSQLQYNGKLYTIPMLKYFYMLMYNKDLLTKAGLDPQQPPRTYEQIREYAKKITAAGKGEAYGFGLPLQVANVWWRVIDMSEAATGHGLYGYDYDSGRFDFTRQKKYLDILLGMKKDGSVFPGEVSMGIEALRSKFAEGKVGMYFEGNWMLGTYNMNLKCANDFDYADIPVLEGEKSNKGYAYFAHEFVINKKSKYVKEAKKYYAFCPDNTDIYAEGFGIGPALIKPAKEGLPATNTAQYKNMMRMESNYLPYYYEPHTEIALIGDNRDKVFTSEFVKAYEGKGDFDKAIADLNTRYNDALKKAVSEGKIKKEDIRK